MPKVTIILNLADQMPSDTSAYKQAKHSMHEKMEHAFEMLDNSNKKEEAIRFLRKLHKCFVKQGKQEMADKIARKLIDEGVSL